ncbi:hypothetical protein [Pseudofrankia asymbiotica]|uniref:hypothetical protein n=1 Tax=Pseudofrankia asymbiotica TaxID=1834516 RepID=UPI0009D6DDAC|nr:hypothetical protein [Pseudofrankia asymbiotica]
MRIIEFDEAQHFNPHRARTFDFYPATAIVAFDLATWRHHSQQAIKMRGGGWGKPKPPLFPALGGRHLQRAFRDLLADLLPPMNGLRPTLRIGHFEVELWLSSADAQERMRLLLTRKLTGRA